VRDAEIEDKIKVNIEEGVSGFSGQLESVLRTAADLDTSSFLLELRMWETMLNLKGLIILNGYSKKTKMPIVCYH